MLEVLEWVPGVLTLAGLVTGILAGAILALRS